MATTAGSLSSGMEGLRPLGLGELMDRTFTLYRRHFLVFVMIEAVPYVLFYVANAVLTMTIGARGVRAYAPGLQWFALFAFLITMVLYAVATFAAQAAGFYAVSETYLGRSTTFGEAYRQAFGKIGLVFGTAFFVSLAIFVGFLLLVIPGLIAICRTSVAIPAALLEDLGPREALSRSMELTKGFAWRAAAIFGLTFIVGIVAALILQVPFQIVAVMLRNTPAAVLWGHLSQIGGVLAECLAGPIAFIATTLFYYDLRVRKEGFDLDRMLASLGGGSSPLGRLTPGPLGAIR